MATILTDEAQEGVNATSPDSPYLATSDSANAWFIGAWLRKTGRSEPRDVRTSRGSTYHVNDMKVKIRTVRNRATIERIS